MTTRLTGQPLAQMRRPKNTELVRAADVEPGDTLWAMSAGLFKVIHVFKSQREVILRSESKAGPGCPGRATDMVMTPDTKLVRVKSERVGGAG